MILGQRHNQSTGEPMRAPKQREQLARVQQRSVAVPLDKTSQAIEHKFSISKYVFAFAFMVMSVSAFALQDSPAVQAARPRHGGHTQAATAQPHESTAIDLEQYKPLLEELERLQKKIEQNVQIPAPRTQSKLLPLLPASSSFYVASPNYGETLHQVNEIFLAELKESSTLNDWWQNKAGMVGMMVEEGVEKFYKFTQYLGDEIVITGNVTAKGPSLVVVAQARKPGLKAFVDQIIKQYAPQPQPPVRVLTPQQLVTAKAQGKYKPLLLLVRTDFVVATTDLATLRAFNAQLNRRAGGLAATPFGQRLAQTYPGGAQMVIGVDLQKMLATKPQGNPMIDMALQQSGFADVKYLVMESKYATGMGTASSKAELSFTGPRHGIASWLAGPAPLPGLDFISTDAAYAVGFMLKSPAQIFDEIMQTAESMNPMAGAGVTQMETELKINLKQDILSKFTGQFAVALDGPMDKIPPFKVVAQVTDADGLQRTIRQLLAAVNASAQPGKSITLDQHAEDGVNYYTMHFANGPKGEDVHYAFADGYLIVGGTQDLVKNAITLHRGGASLPKSTEFQALAPQEHGGQASALLFENPGLFLATLMKQQSPEIANLFHADPSKLHGIVAAAYGEESAIRFVTNNKGFDPTVALAVAALVIPNIMKERSKAQESSATATLRTINVAQVQYMNDYNKGYASSLNTLASCEGGNPTVNHACVLDNKLACTDIWCKKGGFRFALAGSCKVGQCDNYVVVATPADANQGGKNFCSTSDAVLRFQNGPPLTEPISVNECQAWSPM